MNWCLIAPRVRAGGNKNIPAAAGGGEFMAKEAAPEVVPVAERRTRVREIPLISIWGLGLMLALLVVQGLIFYFLFSTDHGLWGWFSTSRQEQVIGRTIDLEALFCELKPEKDLGHGRTPKLRLLISLEMSEKQYVGYQHAINRLRPWIRNQIIDICMDRTRSQLHTQAGSRELKVEIKNLINKKLQATEDVIREVQFKSYIFTG
jgi:flagellar basal body-associated protein FliL